MANALYTKGKQRLLEGYVNLHANTINASLIDTGIYTVNLATHDFRADIPNNAVIATVALGSKTVTDGVFNAANAVFSTVSGNTVEAIVLWHDSSFQANSALIAYIDTATGLPVTPNGGDITVAWDTGTNKIFKLT